MDSTRIKLNLCLHMTLRRPYENKSFCFGSEQIWRGYYGGPDRFVRPYQPCFKRTHSAQPESHEATWRGLMHEEASFSNFQGVEQLETEETGQLSSRREEKGSCKPYDLPVLYNLSQGYLELVHEGPRQGVLELLSATSFVCELFRASISSGG